MTKPLHGPMIVTLDQQYNVREKPTVILYDTLLIIAMQGHQTMQNKRQCNTHFLKGGV